ncbi:MAG: hypothetical protein AB9922_11050 [Bacteroidales bacterium]
MKTNNLIMCFIRFKRRLVYFILDIRSLFKRKSDYYFDDTLLEFYEKSNEVSSFCKIFCDKIFHETNRLQDINKWLDVGIGDGEKILRILKSLNKHTIIDFTFLEPSQRWINYLLINGNLQKLKNLSVTNDINVSVKGYNNTFENYINTNNNFDFEFISFIQVLYESNLVNNLFEFIENKLNKKNFYLLINLENDNNDLCRIRHLLNDNGFNTPVSQLKRIEEFFNSKKIKFNKYDSFDKQLNIQPIDIINNNNHWFYPFILGCPFNNYKNIYSNRERNKIQKIIRDYLLKINIIDINDTTIFATIYTK